MKHTVFGIDIAKSVFQLHTMDMTTGEIVSLKLKREKFLAHFVNRQPCLIGMESCGGAQHWARELIKLGHTVKLLSGKFVKSFVMGNKSDVADATRSLPISVSRSRTASRSALSSSRVMVAVVLGILTLTRMPEMGSGDTRIISLWMLADRRQVDAFEQPVQLLHRQRHHRLLVGPEETVCFEPFLQ